MQYRYSKEQYMKRQFLSFLLRWALNSFGLWVAVRLFGGDESGTNIWAFVLAGLIFSIVNAVLRPIIIVLSLPAILLTLGLFTVIVNGFMVYVSLLIAPGFHMTFWSSVLAGIVLSLVNYIVSSALELQDTRAQEKRL